MTQRQTEDEYERREEFYRTHILSFQSQFTVIEQTYTVSEVRSKGRGRGRERGEGEGGREGGREGERERWRKMIKLITILNDDDDPIGNTPRLFKEA